MSSNLQDSAHDESDARLGVVPASPRVAPEELPGVDIASDHEGVEQGRLVLTPDELRWLIAGGNSAELGMPANVAARITAAERSC